MVSFDVTSLFTNIPLHETIDLAVDLLFDKHNIMFATAQTHFLYNGEYYNQIHGVAMGSPLGLVLPIIFIGHHEKL